MKMRLAWYAGTSTGLAATVIASALHQRANFYSAMVHLAQSSLSLMILVNFIFLIYGCFMYSLQRLCFGQLRPVEIEQLYERAWFAVTETCLAMTIFREEVGAFFLLMFTALVTGKVWGWIGDGRVEVLEQQPPANPRLFHARLCVSLLLSLLYDCWLLRFATNTVVEQARPTMMVMFLFEFAILTVSSFQTALRYTISLAEARVIKTQTIRGLEERRRQVRQQRSEILARREREGSAEGEGGAQEPLPDENDVDEIDIEVPGWEAKGQWVLILDLFADLLKLLIYSAFFCVLFAFYGLPIHIMRDLFMTTRSFVKRLGALLRYRQAVRDMNKYPDATAEELSREDTCIICREEMQPWDAANPGRMERTRPKKLPCGHILHCGCLKSWLERQQVCPTCRRSVVIEEPAQGGNGDAMVFRLGINFPNGRNQNQNQDQNQNQNQNQNQDHNQPGNGAAPGAGAGGQAARGARNVRQNGRNGGGGGGGGVRMFNLGPLRLGFAQGGVQDIQEMAQRLGMPADGANAPQPPQAQAQTVPEHNTNAGVSLGSLNAQLAEVSQRVVEAGQRVQQDLQNQHHAEAQLHVLNHLLHELLRLNQLARPSQAQAQTAQVQAAQAQAQAQVQAQAQAQAQAQYLQQLQQQSQQYAQQLQQLQQQSQQQSQQHGAASPATGTSNSARTGGSTSGQAQQGQPQQRQQPQQQQVPPFPPAAPQWAGQVNPFSHVQYPQHLATTRIASPAVSRHGGAGYAAAIPAGSAELPEGVAIPPGWSLLPLQRLDLAGNTGPTSAPTPTHQPHGPLQPATNQLPELLQMVTHRPWNNTTGRPNESATQVPDTRNQDQPGTGLTAGASQDQTRTSTSQPLPPSSGPAASDAHPSAQQDSPVVTAPRPVAPNWGSSAQLFDGNGGAFGIQSGAPSTSSRQGGNPEAGSNSSGGDGLSQSLPSAAGTDEVEAGAADKANSTESKGKAKAVTVEEAEDDEGA